MPVLRISTLGPLIISLDDQPVYSFKTNKVQALLIYLAVERDRDHPREILMDLLWPEMPLESAQVNLRQTIYRLRQAIPSVDSKENEGQVPIIHSDRQVVRIHPDAEVILDLDEFQESLDDDPERAVALVRGDFLADFYLVDSDRFELWAEQIRQNIHREVLETLSQLAEKYLHISRFDKVQQFAWRQLEIDNLRELAYRQLMIALASTGQRSAALSQFQLCQSRLEKELGLKPSQETIDLYETIQADALTKVKGPVLPKTKSPSQRMPIFLLTDIEGSTRLWDQFHESMLTALLTHNRILEDRISQFGGRILELRGDGVKAVFEGGDPLAAVIEIQKDFQRTDWGEIGNLKIRMGLHGVPTIRKGYDYFKKDDKYYGPVLNHTARIMDTGWGGQILVSEQVRNVCSLPEGARWVDHGFHDLKSLDQPVHIFELTHVDLGSQHFPPLRITPEKPEEVVVPTQPKVTNLPPQLTPFIGRQQELTHLETYLTRSGTRLLTIVGAGGMGKTRLAIAAAEQLSKGLLEKSNADPFPDGIHFVPLAPLDAAEQIPYTIINNLDIPIEIPQTTERSSQVETDLQEKLINFLRAKKMLIILDNFEHLLAGASFISKILEACPHLHIIVTSRERLQLHEEQVFPIQGLEYPEPEASEESLDFAAIELFMQSARRAKPDFSLSTEEKPYLIQICRLIGGMPLGLELAAAWVDILTVKEIAEEIQKSLDFLETDIRNIPTRHRSIRAVFDSSWQYLSDQERQIFPRFSVFRGGFGREAAGQIAEATIRNLASFVNKSLVQYNETEMCYQIHELLRQYGSEQLKRNPAEEKSTRDKFSHYYCAIVKQKMDASLVSGDLHAFNHVKDDYSNIIEAWNWSIHQEHIDNIDYAIDGLCLFYDWNYRGKDGLALCQSAVEKLSEIINREKGKQDNNHEYNFIKRVYAKALTYRAMFALYFDVEETHKLLLESLPIVHDLENKNIPVQFEKALIHFLFGVTYYQFGEIDTSKEHFEESLKISQEMNHEFMGLRNLDALGDIARTLGMPRQAREWYEKSLTRARMKQNRWGEMKALNNLGWAARYMMDYERARQIYQENLSLAKAYNNPFEVIRATESLGFLDIFLGNFQNAIEHFSEAVSISTQFGIQHQAIASRIHIAMSNWLAGNFLDSEPTIEVALSLAKKLTPTAQIFPKLALAEYMVMVGRYREARDQLNVAKALVDQSYSDRFMSGRLTRTLGWLALAEKDYEEAETQFKKSIEHYQFITDDEQIAWSQAGLARALMGQGYEKKAKETLTDALWTTIEMKAFIPLLFILPITALLLTSENPKLAGEVHSRIQNSPFLAKAQFFEDIVYQSLPVDIKENHVEIKLQEKTLKDILWETASSALTFWMQSWLKEPEFLKTYSHAESPKNGNHS